LGCWCCKKKVKTFKALKRVRITLPLLIHLKISYFWEMKIYNMIPLLFIALLGLSSFSPPTDINTVSNNTEEVAGNITAEFLQGLIQKEGIKSYKVTYYKRKNNTTYYECTFPGNNIILFGDVGYNLDKLVRYEVFRKDLRTESIRRLELLF
jgi:hypothetical protein